MQGFLSIHRQSTATTANTSPLAREKISRLVTGKPYNHNARKGENHGKEEKTGRGRPQFQRPHFAVCRTPGKLDEQKEAIAADVKVVKEEIKSEGFDAKIITLLVKARKDERQAKETMSQLQTYAAAIQMDLF